MEHLVNVTDFGADPTGVNDSSTAFQKAIDYAFSTKRKVYIPTGKFLINQSLVLPDKLTIIGENRFFYGGGDMNLCSTLIVSNVSKLFVGKTEGSATTPFLCRLHLEHVAFNRGSKGSIVFDLFQFSDTTITHNFFRDFDIVLNGKASSLTKIEKNYFLNIRQSVITTSNLDTRIQSFTDGYIINNYISGALKNSNVKLLDIKYANMTVISRNFIEFAYWGLNCNSGSGVTISDNIFDYCFVGLRLSQLGGFTIQGNHYTHTNTTHASRWVSPTTEMQTTEWTGIHIRSYTNSLSIVGNVGYDCQRLMLMDGVGYKNIKSFGNIQHNSDNPVIEMKRSIDSNYIDDGKHLRIEELNYQTVNSLPASSGRDIGTFDGNLLYFQGRLIRNDNGVFKDMTGNIVS
ncbi:glycosyl hydrolase family 28-related protein [Peribacillus frigoritolerans]|uniref:glycosyl hydrolase family 28-related protein n=1 Tax=Peribacillus frigoritolerans TaxID=450367 RepID=UPI0025A28BB1|nr:glycosyl hydrolase family 28-related protein [Peribacillus frigoritolerans]MDM5313179.1 glycosyl hydrolase family 28-related protein [Peribacillus frigoritolerans]